MGPWLAEICLLIFVAVACGFTWPKHKAGLFLGMLHVVGVLWGASSLASMLVNLRFVPEYPLTALLTKLGLNVGVITSYFNFRLILGTIFGVGIVVASIRRALKKGPPHLPHIPTPPKAAPTGVPVGSLLSWVYPVGVAVDVVVAVLWNFFDVLWLLLAMIGVYLWRIGAAIAEYLHKLILHRRLWTGLLRVAALFGLVWAFCSGVERVLPSLHRYLITDITIGTSYAEMTDDLLSVALFCLLLSLGVTFHFIVFGAKDNLLPDGQELRDSVSRQAFASATIVVAYLCSSLLIYALVHVNLVSIRGYQAWGPVTLGTAAIIVLISLMFIVSRLVGDTQRK